MSEGSNSHNEVRGENRSVADQSRFGSFVDVVCYNCGVPGHHKANCKKPKVCFICKEGNHLVDDCPVKK